MFGRSVSFPGVRSFREVKALLPTFRDRASGTTPFRSWIPEAFRRRRWRRKIVAAPMSSKAPKVTPMAAPVADDLLVAGMAVAELEVGAELELVGEGVEEEGTAESG